MGSFATRRAAPAAAAWVLTCALLPLVAARTAAAGQNATITSSATATATVGQQITDTVTINGGGPPPMGNLIIAVFPNNPACSGAPAFQCTAIVNGNGPYNCGSTVAAAQGTDTWGSFYSGDGTYNPQQSCGGAGETTVVTAPQPAGSLNFSASTYTVSESGGSAMITVQRMGGSSGAISVDYATSDGTAAAGQNYDAAAGTLSWSDGDLIDKFFEVFILDDHVVNGDKTVNLTLSSPTGGATIGNPSSAMLTITEADAPGPGQLHFAAGSPSVSAGAVAQLPTFLLNGSDGDGSVHYATADGTAKADQDYKATSGTALWSKHSEDTQFLVADLAVETTLDGQGTLSIGLSNPLGGAILGNPSTAQLTIVPPVTATLDAGGSLGLLAPVSLGDTNRPALIEAGPAFYAAVYLDLRNRLVLQCGSSAGDPIYLLYDGIPGDADVHAGKSELILTTWTLASGTVPPAVQLQSFPGCTGIPSRVTTIASERSPRIAFFDIFIEPLGEKEQSALITVADLATGGSVLRWRYLDDQGTPMGRPTDLISFAGVASAPRLRSALPGLLKFDVDVTPPAPGQPYVYTGVIDPSGGKPKVIRQGEWVQYLEPYIHGGAIATLPNGSTCHLWDECTANPAAGGKCRVNAQWEDQHGQPVGSPTIDLFGAGAGNFSVVWPTVTVAGPDRVLVAAEESKPTLTLRQALAAVLTPVELSAVPFLISPTNGDVVFPEVFPKSSGNGYQIEFFNTGRGAQSANSTKAAVTPGIYRQRLLVPQPCAATDTTLCLNGGRFRVDVTDVSGDGTIRSGQGVKLTDDTGYFWFFSPSNVEMLIKVLDACASFNRFWVFATGLTNVQVSATVTDGKTGAMVALFNPQGRVFQPYQNAAAFSCDGASGTTSMPVVTGRGFPAWMPAALPSPGSAAQSGHPAHEPASRDLAGRTSAASACTADATHLCLSGGRYQVSAVWQTPDGSSGAGQSVAITPDTGYFWFFNPSNVEMVLKVLNGCGLNQRYWVFAAGLTNVQVTITVTDTQTQTTKTYLNHQGTPFVPIQDTSAFPSCP